MITQFPVMIRYAFSVCLLALGCPSPAIGATVSASTFHTDGWTWTPIQEADGRVMGFLALRADAGWGENVDAVLFTRSDADVWSSWFWPGASRSEAVAHCSGALGLPQSTDSRWPVPPDQETLDAARSAKGADGTMTATDIASDPLDPVASADRFSHGLASNDPLLPFAHENDDWGGFVSMLEDAGWQAAWLDVWEHGCGEHRVLTVWAQAIAAAELEITAGRVTSAQQSAAFNAAIEDPCWSGPWVLLVEDESGVALLPPPDGCSVIVSGLLRHDDGTEFVLAGSPMPTDAALTRGTIHNACDDDVFLIRSDGTLSALAADERVIFVETRSVCKDECIRWEWPPVGIGHSVPRRVVDARCYCECWADLQPDTDWVDDLPACPCTLQLNPNGNPVVPDGWRGLQTEPPHHPGAQWCVRSDCIGVENEPGQQCCYSLDGRLITHGAGGGTPDAVGACGWFDLDWQHVQEDVWSYDHCVAAGMLDTYLLHRPPNNSNGCAVNP